MGQKKERLCNGTRNTFGPIYKHEESVEPCNITSATIQSLFFNYKYTLLTICFEESVRSRNCICSKTSLYYSVIRDEEKDLYPLTGVNPGIEIVLISYFGTISQFLITGISLNAAMASASSLKRKGFLKENNLKNQIEALAYASPKVISEGFAQYIANHAHLMARHTNTYDFFAHLSSRSFEYVHIRAEIYEYK
ncbi:hypothetical protein K502DRAFT_346481 [Neoconidiobolus thromboides FSU 785]|nr:hypothetical protein K502DRAFT_346481 [Neoconidiobolus thromboides FSU 785]